MQILAAVSQAAGVDAAFGSKTAVELVESCPAAKYDEALVNFIRRTIAETFGEAAVARDCSGGGDDFHFYKTAKPELRTAYVGIGAGAAPSLHDRTMHFDESMLPKAVKLFEAILAKLL